jgi:hypothetical protein
MAIIGAICTVSSAGPSIFSKVSPGQIPPTPDPVIFIALVNEKFHDGLGSLFVAHQSAKSQMLAVALAAISAQAEVDVSVDDPSSMPAGQLPICYTITMRS